MIRPDVLVVDDSPADRASLKIAFAHAGYPLNLRFAPDGVTALGALRSGSEPLPQVMLVDVKMPGLSGLELLQTIKRDPALQRIAIIMFSGSDDRDDVSAAYSNSAAGYIRKPVDIEGLNEVAETVGRLCAILSFPEA